MACYHPKIATIGRKADGAYCRPIIHKTDDLERVRSILPYDHVYRGEVVEINEQIFLPCGQCIGCRLDHSKQWAVRSMLEAEMWQHNFFVTFTYDNLHLPPYWVPDSDTGEFKPFFGDYGSLVPDDFVSFMKRFRSSLKYQFEFPKEGELGVRFYAAGEYGDQSFRPHFHALLFNLPPQFVEGLVLWRNDIHGNPLYNHSLLDFSWGLGRVVVADLTYQSAAYVSRYVMKKLNGDLGAEFYLSKGVIPEMSRVSRRPGIAKPWFDIHKEHTYEFDEVYIPMKNKIMPLLPPHYFDRLMQLEDPDVMLEIKEGRKLKAEASQASELSRTSLSLNAYLCMKEESKKKSLERLTRPLL